MRNNKKWQEPPAKEWGISDLLLMLLAGMVLGFLITAIATYFMIPPQLREEVLRLMAQ